MRRAILIAIAAAVLLPLAVPLPAAAAGSDVLSKVGHIVVIYQENWSFDSLYGKFPGANGLANAGNTMQQVDANGNPYTTLPQPLDTTLKPPGPDTRFPANLPMQPFDASQYVQPDQKTGDLVHRFRPELGLVRRRMERRPRRPRRPALPVPPPALRLFQPLRGRDGPQEGAPEG
jgi:phospholipase C